jgi:hypothetical protein
MSKRDVTAALVGGVIAMLLSGSLAWGAPGAGGVIQGCYDGGGNVKVVTALPCPKGYTPLAWNQVGDPGAPGQDGMSVTSEALNKDDPNCPAGGSAFTSVSGTTYACNGAASPSFTPWDIIPTTIGPVIPGVFISRIVPCPAGDVILGGTFVEAVSAPTISRPATGLQGWRYEVNNGAGSTPTDPVHTLTYCGPS